MRLVRERRPLIHCITNYVTAENVADILLAAGASPMMADGLRDVEEAASCSDGLVLNLGTLNERRAEAVILAGKKTAARGCPVVLDPVGAGTFRFRLETALRILQEVPCTVIRGNASEIRAVTEAVCGCQRAGWESGQTAGWESELAGCRHGGCGRRIRRGKAAGSGCASHRLSDQG
ncbi:MAG: hydroxyethylthiazole kinase [Eubacteriales bacterium]|nr:hydroxyethylthiazole kinase [Eubacteriales bacterium]